MENRNTEMKPIRNTIHNLPLAIYTERSLRSLLIKPLIILAMVSSLEMKLIFSASEIKPRSALSKINVSNSLAEPSEICRKLTNSFLVFLAAPSAIFVGTEIPALRIWDIIPNFSSGGNFAVTAYNSLTNEKLSFQASKFWCGFIFLFGKQNTIHYLQLTTYIS